MSTRPRLYQAEAIVLKGMRVGEADQLLTLLTPTLGKVRALARGLLRPRSKLRGALQPLTRSQLLLARGHSREVVAQAQVLESFLPLREGLERLGAALYAAELVDRLTPEGEGSPFYELLLESLRRLSALGEPGAFGGMDCILRYLELQLLQVSGFGPELYRCIHCGATISPGEHLFSPQGGVLCPTCLEREPQGRPLSLNALKVMRLFQGAPYARASQVRLTPALALELELALREYLRHILEREVKAASFLDRLRQVEPGDTT